MTPSSSDAGPRVRGLSFTPDTCLYVAWAVSVVATLGSPYFSEVRHLLPCTLCWYQRIGMYSLAVILGVALYHVLEEWGVVQPLVSCVVGVPCTTRWIDWFGFVTIPVLSFTAFSIMLAWRRR